MKVNLKSFFQGRSKALSMLSLFTLIGLSSSLQFFSNQTNKVLSLQDGLQTCFTRIHNSYTARLIGGGSDYLNDNFVKTSEECMGEVIRVYENLNVGNSIILDDLNTVATDLSWFHQKVLATENEGLFDGNTESVLLANIGSRYEKLEIKKDEINQGLVNAKNILTNRKSNIAVIFYSVAALVPLLLVIEYFTKRRQEEIIERSEKEAKSLMKEAGDNSQAVHELVLSTLSGMGLSHVARVFELNRAKVNSPDALADSSDHSDIVGRPIMLTQRGNEQVDKIWGLSEKNITEVDNRESFELEEIISNVVDHISSKIFTLGIKLDIQTEPIKVYGEKEPLEQAFYNLLIDAIDNYSFDDPNKFLKVTTRKLGSTVLFDLYDSGAQYSQDFLRQVKGLVEESDEFTDLAIARDLIEGQKSKISFENVANEEGQLVGRKVQVVLQAANSMEKKAPKRRLARVEKMTKKEFLKKFNEGEA